MNPLYFLAPWEKKDKTRTWSGTCWGLLSALRERHTIIDIDISATKIDQYVHKVKKIFFRGDGMGLYNILTQRRRLMRRLKRDKDVKIIFQFSEVILESPDCRTYLYIDENVNNVKVLYEQDRLTFEKSVFRNVGYHEICNRTRSQVPYLKQCAGIFTMGHWQRNSLIENLKIPADKVHHVGGGANVSIERINYSYKQRNKILFVGKDFEGKGGKVVLEAFKLLKLRLPDVQLHIAGPNSLIETGNVDGVYQYGFVSREKVSDLMNLCDVFCMPSYYEAYGMVFIEALTYGLPCIGRNRFEMPYFIEEGETGFLIENDDPEILSQRMETLLNDPSYSERVRLKRDWYVENYSWKSVANRITQIINRVGEN